MRGGGLAFADFDHSAPFCETGAERVILGCTELPLLITGTRMVDTLDVLARAAFREAAGGMA